MDEFQERIIKALIFLLLGIVATGVILMLIPVILEAIGIDGVNPVDRGMSTLMLIVFPIGLAWLGFKPKG